MALQINQQTSSGFQTNYTKIQSVSNKSLDNINYNIFNTSIITELWKDLETREMAKDGGSEKFADTKIYYTDQIFPDIASTYNYLKTLPEFGEAVDC